MGTGGRGPRRLLWLMLREWRVCGATPLRRQPKKLHAKQTDWLKACNNTIFMSTICHVGRQPRRVGGAICSAARCPGLGRLRGSVHLLLGTLAVGTDFLPQMTGLDPDTDCVVEIYCLITDGQLRLLDEIGWGTVVHQRRERMALMDEWCTRVRMSSSAARRFSRAHFWGRVVTMGSPPREG